MGLQDGQITKKSKNNHTLDYLPEKWDVQVEYLSEQKQMPLVIRPQEAEVSFPWQKGDILVLDNMLVAHARNPFQGKRKIYVSMGNMLTLKDLVPLFAR